MGGTLIKVECAVGCGETDRVPAFEDRSQPGGPVVRPVQAHPYVCLGCWRLGWRSNGEGTYKLEGHPQVVGETCGTCSYFITPLQVEICTSGPACPHRNRYETRP